MEIFKIDEKKKCTEVFDEGLAQCVQFIIIYNNFFFLENTNLIWVPSTIVNYSDMNLSTTRITFLKHTHTFTPETPTRWRKKNFIYLRPNKIMKNYRIRIDSVHCSRLPSFGFVCLMYRMNEFTSMLSYYVACMQRDETIIYVIKSENLKV